MASFDDGSGLGYIPSWDTVTSLTSDGLTLSSNFGTLKNANPGNVQVVVKVSVMIPPTAALGSKAAQFFVGSTGQASLQAVIVGPILDPLTNQTVSYKHLMRYLASLL